MLLDHPSLEPFEPVISNILDYAFGDSLRGLAVAGLHSGDEWHTQAAPLFKAACLPGFRKAQDAIANNVLDLERRIVFLKKEEINERASRNPSGVEAHKTLRTVLENRELVLRRLIDGFLWVLFWPNKWILRRLRLEGGIKRVDSASLDQMLKGAAYAHAKDDESVWIICDLSTLAQIGDMIFAKWEPTRNRMKLIVAELKVGPKNVQIYKRLHDAQISDLNEEVAKISKDLGSKAGKQAARMVRQEQRLKNFTRVNTQ